MDSDFTFTISSIAFDEQYQPADNTRVTTNFANLARGADRQANLRNTLRMIANRFNSLVDWDNPAGDRYWIELTIRSVSINLNDDEVVQSFPIIEMLQTTIVDRRTDERIAGVIGNNFSSYLRDYDFSVLLLNHLKEQGQGGTPAGFGDLHGSLFKQLLASKIYRDICPKQPIICLSVSSSKCYHRTANEHPMLGVEYRAEEPSVTDEYFAKMGMKVRYFLPKHGVAPLAFYHIGDLACDYTSLELASTISTMETFQKIYRPEIYNANSVAAERYQPSLTFQDYSLTRITYDREERSMLAIAQGKYAEQHLIRPYGAMLAEWSAQRPL